MADTATVSSADSSNQATISTPAASAGTSTESSAQQTKLPESKRWADVSDDEKDEIESKIESLAIDEPKKVNEFLEDPESANIEAVTSGGTPYTSAKRFEDLNISAELLQGLYVEMKFERPSKIQAITLPMILTPPYKNLIAQAHNGSGKTTCFVLGMLSRVDPKLAAPQALCICPTRELAMQNQEVLERMGKYTGITSILAIPMEDMPMSKLPPVNKQVVIGTPGTINKWFTARKLGMNSMNILVFDEADHMLAEGGFKQDSERIMKGIVKIRPNCQVLLFSATFNDAVKAFATKIVTEISVKEYNQLFVKKEELSLDSLKQYKVYCPNELSKIMVIKDKILEMGQKVGQTIIFVKTRNSASMLHKSLVEYGYEVTTIQGALQQEDRDKIVKEFKEGLTQVLISTDLLARGFDQAQVNLVVNYDLPLKYDTRGEPDYEVYLHRIGRAGRFGRKGAVFNLLCGDRDNMLMTKIETHFNSPVAEVASWEKDEDFEDALKKAGLM
ncbi:DEAD-box ATP-dependent RNA helicase 38 [Heracleum sosnowskyi]|uniref:RNA helicase n=1 Tax=Heracleum sosnowskyi TaxID=360622 RepID=A0AAD8JFF4_9APIA|nr:DEAD-box ATP-dependent RNA helicase 38 [Heracleum sosnowskyi]